MCIEFQHLSCQVVVIKGLAYLKWLEIWKTGLTLAFTGKNYFLILGLGLGLDTSGLVNIPGYNFHCVSSAIHIVWNDATGRSVSGRDETKRQQTVARRLVLCRLYMHCRWWTESLLRLQRNNSILVTFICRESSHEEWSLSRDSHSTCAWPLCRHYFIDLDPWLNII